MIDNISRREITSFRVGSRRNARSQTRKANENLLVDKPDTTRAELWPRVDDPEYNVSQLPDCRYKSWHLLKMIRKEWALW